MSTELNPVQHAPLPVQATSLTMEGSEFTRLNARDIFNIFLRHSRLLLMVILGVTAAVMLFVWWAGPLYIASSFTKVDLLPSIGTNAVSPQEREMRMMTQQQLTSSPALVLMVVKELNLHRSPALMGSAMLPKITNRAQESQQLLTATVKLGKVMQVKRTPNTQLIEVDVKTPDPILSATIADQFPIVLQQWDNHARYIRRQRSLTILWPELQRAKVSAIAADQAVADARSKYRLLPGAGTDLDLQQIKSIANDFVGAAGSSVGSSAHAAGVAGSNIGGVPIGAQVSPDLAAKQREYDDLVQKQAELSVTYGNNYPELKAVNAQVASVGSQIAQESQHDRDEAIAAVAANARRDADLARSDASGAAARASTLKGYLNQYVGQAYQNTQNNVLVSKLERDAAVKKDAYQSLATQFEGVVNNSTAGGIIATALAPAAVPTTQSNLSWSKALLAALIGSVVLGCLIAFGREMIDNRLRSSQQVRRRFGLRTMAMLPRIDGAALAAPKDNPVVRQPRSIFAETARTLYTEVTRLSSGGSQVVTVTSPLPGEGKSTSALTLAAAASMLGRKTILVDLDLRRYGLLQQLHRQTGGADLIDFLSKRRPVSDLGVAFRDAGSSHQEDGPAPKLPAILSACSPVIDPAALIASVELSHLVQELRGQFEFIVINAPPLLAVRDAKILSRMADDTLMVVKWGKTTVEEVEAAVDVLDRPPAGIVFNDVDYAEHARRRYNDSIQFIARATDYYDDAISAAPRRFFARFFGQPSARMWAFLKSPFTAKPRSTSAQPLIS